MRQALSGMLWSKQYYFFDLDRWLAEHHQPGGTRNRHWAHMLNDDIISMPDKWEYPWYAAWDLAFHTVALSMVDSDFARDQIELMLSERYLHPNGQMPAYEWNFGDVNPPVHAWATLFCYHTSPKQAERGDREFLARAFQKLLLNFTWWVNRKDPAGNNLFEGGFLGLDNIGVFDRSARLPGGRAAGAGRRHRLDGVLLPEHAGDGPGAGPRRSVVRADGGQVRGALPVDRLVHGLRRQHLRRDVGRGGRLLLRRPALARRERHAPEGAIDGGPAAPVRDHGHLPAATPNVSPRRWSASGRSWPSGPT